MGLMAFHSSWEYLGCSEGRFPCAAGNVLHLVNSETRGSRSEGIRTMARHRSHYYSDGLEPVSPRGILTGAFEAGSVMSRISQCLHCIRRRSLRNQGPYFECLR